jgi:hypothetical protein
LSQKRYAAYPFFSNENANSKVEKVQMVVLCILHLVPLNTDTHPFFHDVTSMRENRKEKMPNHKARSYDF